MWLPLLFAFNEAPSRVYVRGEVLEMDAAGATSAEVTGTPLKAVIEGNTVRLDTAALRPGTYQLKLSSRSVPFTIAARPNPERYPLWKWGGTAPKSFGYYRERGFTGVGSPMIATPPSDSDKIVRDIRLSLDEAARQGLDYSIYLNPLYDPRWKSDGGVQAERFDGQKMTQPDPRNPKVVGEARETATRVSALFGAYPAWKQALLGSEFQLDYNFSSSAAALARNEANVDVRSAGIFKQPKENLPVAGIIEDSNPRYQFLKWWYHRGMGDAALNESMSAILRGQRSDLLTWHDPYRLAPVSGSAKGLGAISTWTYAHPDMTRLYFTRVLQAAARIDRQLTMQTITLFLYPRFVESVGGDVGSLDNDKPGGSRYYTAGPDFAKEALWLVFSQRADIIGIYFGGALQPDDPNADPNLASPATFDAIGEVSKTLIEPYGPTVRAGSLSKPKVAVLLSAAAVWLGNGPKQVGYANEQILPYASLLAMNQIPFDVVLDEDVVAGKLSGYDVLVMPQAGALTRSMASQIRQFTAGGKKVIADASLVADVGPVTKTSFDFSFQAKVDGVALSRGDAVTADESRRRMEAYAAELGQMLKVDRMATADSPRVLLNTVDAGDLKLVFAVNDNRTFGPRFGAAKLHLEKGVNLPAKLNIQGKAIYDTFTGEKLSNAISTTLPAAEGKLFAVLPEAAPTISVDVPKAFTVGKVAAISGVVKFPSGKSPRGAYPVSVELIDPTGRNSEFSWSIAAKDGIFQVPYIPAINDPSGTWKVRVTDLITRKVVEGTFER